MTWQPHEARHVGLFAVMRLRSAHSHEAAHEVVLDDRTLRVLPDGHTTARKRSDIMSDALTGQDGRTEATLLASLVGALVLAGATNLELDGQALIPAGGQRGQWRVVLHDDGTAAATYLGATT